MTIETKHYARVNFGIISARAWNNRMCLRIIEQTNEIASKWGIDIEYRISGLVVYVGANRDSVVCAATELEKYLRRYKGIKFHE